MATQDKVLLMHQVEDTLKPRMFANLLEEAMDGINEHLDEYDITRITASEGSDDLLKAFIEAKKVEGRSDKTLIRYQYNIDRFLKFSKCGVKDITTAHIRAFFAQEHDRGVADSTIEGFRQILSSFYAWLDKEHKIRANPVLNVGVIKCQKKVRESYVDDDIEKLKRNCKSIRDLAIIMLLLTTGCRISEITNLNRSDVDLDNMELKVLGKGNKERTAYLNDVSVLALREYLLTRGDSNEALFIGKRDERLQPNGVRFMLKRLGERANVENVHPHRFRRTMITNALIRGMPIQDVAIVVGHDKIDTTMRYYASNKARIKNTFQQFMT